MKSNNDEIPQRNTPKKRKTCNESNIRAEIANRLETGTRGNFKQLKEYEKADIEKCIVLIMEKTDYLTLK